MEVCMTDPQPVRISLGPLTVVGEAWGPPAGPVVLLLHGWLDNAGSFATLAPVLASARPDLRFVAIDLPGHGQSDHRPAGARIHFIDGVVDIVLLLDALDAPRATIIGHSMGAALATLFAGALPDRVERLILLDGLGPLSATAEDTAAQLARGLNAATRPHGRGPRIYPDRAPMRDRLAAANPGHTTAACEALLSRGTRQVDGGFVFSHDPRLKASSLVRMTEGQIIEVLARITAPTTLIWARDGFATHRTALVAREAAVPNLTTHEVDGGHHVHLNAPNRVAPLVLAALDGPPHA
jgi:pimeloyl-ACP methyl ester carboxylesterase